MDTTPGRGSPGASPPGARPGAEAIDPWFPATSWLRVIHGQGRAWLPARGQIPPRPGSIQEAMEQDCVLTLELYELKLLSSRGGVRVHHTREKDNGGAKYKPTCMEPALSAVGLVALEFSSFLVQSVCSRFVVYSSSFFLNFVCTNGCPMLTLCQFWSFPLFFCFSEIVVTQM
jgi:hypothetical protein